MQPVLASPRYRLIIEVGWLPTAPHARTPSSIAPQLAGRRCPALRDADRARPWL